MFHLRLSPGDERARTKWTCFCSISSLASLPSFPPLQSLVAKHEKRLVALEAFRVGRLEVGTVHTKGLHPLRCRTIVLPPPTFSVPNEVLPLPSYSLTHSESERKKTHPPLLEHEIWRRQGAQGGGGLKILEPSPSFTPRPDDHDTCRSAEAAFPHLCA